MSVEPIQGPDRDLAERIDAEGEGLTPWEIDFVESILRQLDGGRPVTPRQRKVLEQLEDQRCE